MTADGPEKPAAPAPAAGVSPRGPSGRQPGTGRKPTHSARIMRRTLRALATTRLDGRSAIARGDSPDADRRGARQEPRATRPRAGGEDPRPRRRACPAAHPEAPEKPDA